MTPAEQNCLILIALTAILLILAHVRQRRGGGQYVGLLAIVTVLAANAAMFAAIRDRGGWGFLAESGSRSAPSNGREAGRGGSSGGDGATRGGTTANAYRTSGGGGDAGAEADDDEGVAGGEPGLMRVANDAALDVADWLAAKFQRTANDAIGPRPQSYTDCAECPEMVPVLPGNLLIGAETKSDAAVIGAAAPRMMRVWPGFLISRTEITIGHLRAAGIAPVRGFDCAVSSADPSAAASCVSVDEVSAYLDWLKQKTGRRYRLPDSAEWEFAARSNAAARRPAVDMGGGLAELVADCWPALTPAVLMSSPPAALATERSSRGTCRHHVVKDGTPDDAPHWRTFAARRALAVGTVSPRVGFRVVRDVDVTASGR